MVQQGLFERFDCDWVFGMHNWPLLPKGEIGVRAGAIMASADEFDIEVKGLGAHAAMPHLGVDPVVIASHITIALQSLISRQTNPLDAAVLSVTQLHSGSACEFLLCFFFQLSSSVRVLNLVGSLLILI